MTKLMVPAQASPSASLSSQRLGGTNAAYICHPPVLDPSKGRGLDCRTRNKAGGTSQHPGVRSTGDLCEGGQASPGWSWPPAATSLARAFPLAGVNIHAGSLDRSVCAWRGLRAAGSRRGFLCLFQGNTMAKPLEEMLLSTSCALRM